MKYSPVGKACRSWPEDLLFPRELLEQTPSFEQQTHPHSEDSCRKDRGRLGDYRADTEIHLSTHFCLHAVQILCFGNLRPDFVPPDDEGHLAAPWVNKAGPAGV